MKHNILILGSTGKLGDKLFKYCVKHNIYNLTITAYKNKKKLNKQKNILKNKNYFCLNNEFERFDFLKLIKHKKFKIIYFLDYGAQSLVYIDLLIKNNINSYFAIANKELLIAGGYLLIKKLKFYKHILIPLDSEHFSLYRSDPKNKEIEKLYITASGGPFYFRPKINLDKVSFEEVIKHPKWNMGYNNSIDSSNFINKVLEIFEVSLIYNIDISKIDFLISKEAFIHSLICYNDKSVSINCFPNDMLISLVKPLTYLYKLPNLAINNSKYLNLKYLKLEKFDDNRFKIHKFLKKIKEFDHKKRIKFMILNNIAHQKYIKGLLNYNDIIKFIMENIEDHSKFRLKNFKSIISYINEIKLKY